MQKLVALFVLVLCLLVIQVNAQQQPTGTSNSQSTGQANTQSLPDAELIKQAALDYIEGYYEGIV